MNTPNKLTLLRTALVPFFIAFLLIDTIPLNYVWALVVFIVASITDALDGYLARKYNQITTFGKFLDPLADKVLVVSAIVCFIELGLASSVAVVAVITREFMVTSIRLVAVSSEGKVIAAGNLGKIKTIISMVSIIAILLLLSITHFIVLPFSIVTISHILMWITAGITVISGIQYLVENIDCINVTK